MKAAVVRELNKVAVEEVSLEGPQSGEVKVKMAATGVCHSDLSIINGTIPSLMPIIIGHEGAGVVEEVGEGVTKVSPGDHVVLSFVPNCGTCFHCIRGEAYLCKAANTLNMGTMMDGTRRVSFDGGDLGVMSGLGCMAETIVAPVISVVPIRKDIPLNVAALVGCAVTTGVGAVLNTAQIEAGARVAVFGCGGVGLSVIQGARLAGAERIIAIDLADNKLEMAKKFGATHTINASEVVYKEIKKVTDGQGVDYAFEAIGNTEVIELAYNCTRNGGSMIVVGVGSPKERASFNALTLSLKAKTICGCMYGSANPSVDFPKMLNLYKAGRLDLDGMITKTYSIDEVPQAFADLESGENARGVIVY